MAFAISRFRIPRSVWSASVWLVLTFAACIDLPMTANAQSRDAKASNKDETKNPGFFHHVTWCSRKADELQSEYDAAMQAYAEAQARYDAAKKALSADTAFDDKSRDTGAMNAAQDEMDALRHEIAGFRSEWNNIRGDCDLPGDIGSGPPQSSGGGGGAGGGGGGGGGAGGGGGGGSAGGGGASSPGSGKGRGTTVDLLLTWSTLQKLAKDTAKTHGTKGFGILLGREFSLESQIQRTLDDVQHPPIRTDSVGVVASEKPNSPELPSDISPVARSGLEGTAFLEQELAHLHNYIVDYGRYLGAAQAKDTAAAGEQMRAMTKEAVDAINAATSAAAKLSETDKQLIEILSSALGSGATITGAFHASLNPDLDQELRASGISASDLSALNDSLRAITPADAKTDLSAAKGRLAADSAISQKLSDKRSFAKWPVRPEQFALDHAAATSDRIKTAIESGEAPPNGTEDVGDHSGGVVSAKVIVLLAAFVVVMAAATYWSRRKRRPT